MTALRPILSAALVALALSGAAAGARANPGVAATWTQLMDQCLGYIAGDEIATDLLGDRIDSGTGPDGIERLVHQAAHDMRLRFGASDVAVPKNARHCLVWTEAALPEATLSAMHDATMARYADLVAAGWTLGDATFDDAPLLEKDIRDRLPSGCLAAGRINIDWAPGTASFYARLIGMTCTATQTDKG